MYSFRSPSATDRSPLLLRRREVQSRLATEVADKREVSPRWFGRVGIGGNKVHMTDLSKSACGFSDLFGGPGSPVPRSPRPCLHTPERYLHHVALAVPVGVRRRAKARRKHIQDHPQLGGMIAQRFADVNKTKGDTCMVS